MKKRKLNKISSNDIDNLLCNKFEKIKIITKPLKEDKSTQTDFNIELYSVGKGFSLGHIFLTILLAGSPPLA